MSRLHRKALVWDVAADRRYRRSGCCICGLYGITVGETWDMTGNLKTFEVQIYPFSAYPAGIGIHRPFLEHQGTILRVYRHGSLDLKAIDSAL